ncbi:class I SAM-dependent methyltransferase [Candidatus Latescibacterota bacterium]
MFSPKKFEFQKFIVNHSHLIFLLAQINLLNVNYTFKSRSDEREKSVFGIFHRKKKSFERDSLFYDELFRTGGHEGLYHVHYTESRYYPVWRRGAEIISSMDNPKVLDIGCGPGQFASLLHDTGITSYKGIDHSAVAIEMARENVPQWAGHFTVNDVFEPDNYRGNATIVVLFEVLEHLEKDLNLLRMVPPGTSILFSVPSYGSASHVRHYKSEGKVEKRYKQVVDIILLETFADCPEPGKTIYLVHGTIKPDKY